MPTQNIQQLQEQIAKLEEENLKLSKTVLLCQTWMRKEVEGAMKKIVSRKVMEISRQGKDAFMQENQPQILATQVQNYFGEILLLNAPKQTIEYLINAEMNYYNLQKNPHLDGLSVISSYHKILDLCIEQIITNDFRKFAQKKGQIILRVNDPLEKALHLIVNKRYILSVGRLYALIDHIRSGEKMYDYGKCFSAYLDKYTSLRMVLLDDGFFKIFREAVESEVFGAKRHQGKITFEETKKARALLVGELVSKESILYKMLEALSVPY